VRAFTFFDLAFLGGVSLNAADCDPGMAADGGGDNFECIPVNTYTTLLFPIAGVGFSAGMKAGDSPFGYVYGDSFDNYSVAFTGTMTLSESYSGGLEAAFSGDWITMDAQPIYMDDFDSYTVEDPLAQTMNSGTGFSAAWQYGTMPQYMDDFDSYTVEDPLAQTMNGGTGFSAAWEYGDL
jgi:hypothetical protein